MSKICFGRWTLEKISASTSTRASGHRPLKNKGIGALSLRQPIWCLQAKRLVTTPGLVRKTTPHVYSDHASAFLSLTIWAGAHYAQWVDLFLPERPRGSYRG